MPQDIRITAPVDEAANDDRFYSESRILLSFTVDEFARLCVIFTQDESCREALISSGRGLSQLEIDTNISPNLFCSTDVEPIPNNVSTCP